MKNFYFCLVFSLAFVTTSVSQTVTKTTAPGSTTIDGCGTYCSTLPGITFTSGDFANGCRIADVNVSMRWAKTDGTCAAPGIGNSFHNETSFRIDGPTGNNEVLIPPSYYGGGATMSAVVTTFNQGSAQPTVAGGTPNSGTFGPAGGGNLNDFNGTSAFGAWALRAGDNAGGDPLCVDYYSITIQTLTDNTNPVISGMPSSQSIATTTGACSATHSWTEPTATDDCELFSLIRIAGPSSGSTFPIGATTVTYRATDKYGNTTDASFVVTVYDGEAPVINCPADFSAIAPNGSCSANVIYNVPGASDNCPGVTVARTAGPASGTAFNVGPTTVTHRATDAVGNYTDCSFVVTVLDLEDPVISCPGDINVTSTTSSCGATVSFTPPVGTDNCAVSTALTGGLAPGMFPSGTTVVTYTATDASSNQASCSFNVTVDPIPNGTLSLTPSPICLGDQTTLTFDFTSGVGPFNVEITDGVNFYTILGANDGDTYDVTPPTTVTYSYVSIQDASGCTRTTNFGGTAQVIVTPLPNVSFSGLNSIYCETASSATLIGSQNGGTFTGNGISNLGGGQGTFTPATAGPTGPYTITYTFTDLNNCTDSESQVVYVDEQPVANAGSGGSECDLNFTFNAVPSVGVGTWTLVSGPGVPFFSNINVATSIVQVSTPGTYIFKWTEVNGQCSDSDQITVDFYEVPSPNPGFGGAECDLNFQLGATPSVGTGTWTATGSGTATYAPNANDPNAVATVTAYGSYVFTWTENNGGCTNAASVTVDFDELPVANAGSGGDECDLNFTFSAVPSVGNGLWTASGPGAANFTSATNANTPVTVSNYGTYIFTWTETNGSCSSVDNVIVNFYEQPVADAGVDGSACSLSYTMTATSSVGTGVWTYTGPGNAIFADDSDPNTNVTVDVIGDYFFTWTETNGTCSDNASVLVSFYAQPIANAGTGGNECDLDFTLGAIPSSGVGLWTATGPGTATFTNDLSANTDVSVSVYGTYSFTWTEINGTCSDAASVTVNFYEQPVAVAGLGGDECDLDFLASAVPSSGTGLWTQTGGLGTATFSNASSAVNIITVDAYGTYDFTWTETNGTCVDSQSITINFFEQPVANAGAGGSICDLDFTLSATLSTGSGQWTSSGPGTATFVSDTDPGTTVSVSQSGNYTFTWTETNGSCTDVDDVQVTFYDQPVANAGSGGNECDLNFTLSAVASFGTGTWTYTGAGNAFFSNPNSPSATVVVDAYGAYTFTWTEVNGICSDNASIAVNFYQQPVANAGLGGSECDLDFNLDATPSAGNGEWTFSGPGTATFNPNANDPDAVVTVDAGGTYIFTWTENNNGCANSDDVTVIFNALPVVSFTGLDAQYCIDQTTPVPLTGTPAGGTFSGLGISGNSFVPSITGVGTIFITYTYTDVNGCTDSETQGVDVNGLPVVTFSGLGTAYCEDDATAYTLTGSPLGGTFSGSGITGDDFIPSDALSGNQTITYTYTDPFGCSSNDMQQVTINELPVVSFTGLAASYCEDASNVSLTGSPVGGTFSGTGIIGSSFSSVSAGTGIHAITYTYTDGNGCTNSVDEQVTVNANPLPTITPSGTSEICAGDNLVLNAGGGYSAYNWSNSTNGQTTNVTQAGSYNVIVTTAEGCSGTSAPVQVVVNQPPVVNLGADTIICTASSLTLDAENTGSNYSWSTQEISQTITVTTTGSYTVQVTDQNGCVGSDNITVTVSNLLDPIIVASGPLEFCAGGSVTLDGGAGYDSYQWSTSETDQDITVSTPGVIELQVWDEFGCTGTDEVIVSVLQLPNAIITPSGTIAVCNGDTAVLSANAGLASYSWSPNLETGQTISVWEAGTYSVTVQDPNNGCFNTSPAVEVVVNTTVTPTIVPSGPTEFCAGGSVSLTVEPGPYTSYLWCSGSTTPSISVTQTGDYCVTVLDANGCLDTTLVGTPLHIEVWNPQPLAVQQGDSIVVTNGPFNQYQWYFNGVPLPGATGAVVNPAASGNYYVEAWDDNACSGTSYNVEFTFTGIADFTQIYEVSIYPNPTESTFTLEADFGRSLNVVLNLTDVAGREVISPETINGSSSIKRTFDIDHLSAGIYYIQLITEDGVAVKQLVKR